MGAIILHTPSYRFRRWQFFGVDVFRRRLRQMEHILSRRSRATTASTQDQAEGADKSCDHADADIEIEVQLPLVSTRLVYAASIHSLKSRVFFEDVRLLLSKPSYVQGDANRADDTERGGQYAAHLHSERPKSRACNMGHLGLRLFLLRADLIQRRRRRRRRRTVVV